MPDLIKCKNASLLWYNGKKGTLKLVKLIVKKETKHLVINCGPSLKMLVKIKSVVQTITEVSFFLKHKDKTRKCNNWVCCDKLIYNINKFNLHDIIRLNLNITLRCILYSMYRLSYFILNTHQNDAFHTCIWVHSS